MKAILGEDTAHPLWTVENSMSRVVDVVPVGKVDIGGKEFGFDDQKPARIEELVELVKLTLRMVKMFGHFATYDKIIGRS